MDHKSVDYNKKVSKASKSHKSGTKVEKSVKSHEKSNSKSNDRFINSASGIKFALKGNAKLNGKKYHNEFYQNTENSYDIEFEERPLGGKYKNESNFRPSTKQTVDQNKYKKMKEKYEFDKIEENIEEEQQKDEKEKEKKSKNNKDEESDR